MIRSAAARSIAMLGTIVCGCAGEASPGSDGDGDTTGAVEPPPTPDFTEPASGRIDVPVSRVEDVVLGVIGTVPGNTRLLVDGTPHAAFAAGDSEGAFGDGSLTMRLRGAMVPGVHTMQLSNAGGEEPLVSRIVEAYLVAVDAPPSLAIEPLESARPGSAVLSGGAADHAVLAILDDTIPDAPVLVVAPLSVDGWDFEAARRVSIPGYRRAPGDRGIFVAVQRVGPLGDPEDDRLRVAWRVGAPGTAVDFVDAAWAEIGEATAGVRAFDLDPAVLGPYEHAELRRPALLGDTLVAEVLAATDIEAPRPGDRALLHARLSGVPAMPIEASRVVLGERQDVDAIGPVLDTAGTIPGEAPLLGARLDGRMPVVLEADSGHGRLAIRPSVDDGHSRALSGVGGPLSTVLGAFGSRRVAGRLPGDTGRMRLVEIDDWGTNGVVEHSLTPDTIPDTNDATGELAVATIAGHAVWLLPYGPDVPVHAVITGAEDLLVQPLEDLRCTQIAVAFDPRDPMAPRSVACATGGGEITTSRLHAETGS